MREGDLLFEPSAERVARAQLSSFMSWLAESRGLQFASYGELWSWSVGDLPAFWSAFADFADVPFRHGLRGDGVLEARLLDGGAPSAEGASWFSGAELNYADCVLRHDPGTPAVVAVDESGGRAELTYGELAELAARAAAGLAGLGVGPGDRVAGVLPNGVAAVATFLAAASLGAIWSSCAPEFGAPSMLDRFVQIDPKVLVGAPSYRYGGTEYDLTDKMATLRGALAGTAVTTFDELASAPATRLEPVSLPFSHPLWILYSSGTTGLPKAIVQSHGGIVLEHLKVLLLHSDVTRGERFFWYSTTGWMMWNLLVGGLLTGATIVLYDGSPLYPDPLCLWRMASREKVTYFGTSAPYIESCRRAGLRPRSDLDLASVRSVGSTGAPLSPEGFAWAAEAVGDDVLVGSVSGGTDVCTAFLVGCPLLPVHAGELQCAALGCAAESWDSDGRPVVGEVGELVITAPMPSMPVALWGDADGRLLHRSYFERYPGSWRHGDWVKKTKRETFVVYGRSDATLNRGGVRMGTAEFYRVAEAVDGVADTLVVDTTELGRKGELILFVVPEAGRDLAAVEPALRARLRESLSPRHVPDRVVGVRQLPRTLNGKKVEVPVRRVLTGTPVAEVLSRDSLANPEAFAELLEAMATAGLFDPGT